MRVVAASIFALVALTGCQTTNGNVVIADKYRVVHIPPEMFDECPAPGRLPKSDTLTEVQVAKTVIRLYSNNKKCKAAIDAIKKYVEAAEAVVDGSAEDK